LNVFINFAMTAMKIPHYFKSEDMTPRRAESIYGKYPADHYQSKRGTD
jgi:hypothetical protein